MPTNAKGDASRKLIHGFIKECLEKKGASPSFREIAKGTGLALNTVVAHLKTMEKEGMIKKTEHGVVRLPGYKLKLVRE